MQISYPYIVWNNVPKFYENRVSSFWDMHQSMCVSVVSPKLGDTTSGAGAYELDCSPFRNLDCSPFRGLVEIIFFKYY